MRTGPLFMFCVVCATAGPARASTGGRETQRAATNFYHAPNYFNGWFPYVIETINLSPGADTVIHVQTMSGEYFAGNDDCGCPGGGLRSRVALQMGGSDADLNIIVRGYSIHSGGTATLRITGGPQGQVDIPISFTGGYQRYLPWFGANAHFLTTQEQGGSGDTIILVVSGDASHAVAYDDDNGVGLMSWAHVNDACSGFCDIIVGAYAPYNQGTTTLIWDDDIHVADGDNDGMGDALELAVGTSSNDQDTDDDGLADGEDTMGIDNAGLNLRFPYYGSQPRVPDLFVEADWQECLPGFLGDTMCGNPPDLDLWRMRPSAASQAAQVFAPDIAVHFDNGWPNYDPTTWTTFGAWTGGTRVSGPLGRSYCEWRTPERSQHFHGAQMVSGGGSGNAPGPCVRVVSGGKLVAHELGHNMGLQHGGGYSGDQGANCKPNYRSTMSYSLQEEPDIRLGADLL